jgi:YHS domain-containing protein/thiol-disulfide isomerase/thioredoxin
MSTTARLIGAALVVASMTSPALAQQAFRWETDLEGAKRLAAQTNRLVLVHFSAPWCQPCARLEERVFSNPGFAPAMQNQYVLVKLNLDHHAALAKQYNVTAIPADVILTSQGQVVHKLQSPPTATEYVGTMQQIAAASLPAAPATSAQVASAAGPAASAPVAAAAAAPVASAPVQPASQAATAADDRYADYYRQREAQIGNIAAAQPPAASMPASPATASDVAAAPSQSSYSDMSQSAQPDATTPRGPDILPHFSASVPEPPRVAASQAPAPQPPASRSPTQSSAVANLQLPAGCPPLGMDGFCPVTLVEQRTWKQGDVRFGAIHHNRTYLFASADEQQRFLANPEAYCPVLSGDDPVIAMNENRSVTGYRKHGVFCGNRVFLFSTEDTLAEFRRNPNRYIPEIRQARR